MSAVLANRYRPKTLAQVVGQDPTVRALTHALDQGHLHHAYLFTGTRGVGKTTLARIVAKCLNCKIKVSATPCEQCTHCTAIDARRFVDLIELDAATNTRVEEMRQLLESANFAPSMGRYKVYVIDEVHMLSSAAFNAMLKTLEEPPEHVKFILATTHPQKIPNTVLSRCLQFSLRNISLTEIKEQLSFVLQQEKIDYEIAALTDIARSANGSLRDALSILDRVVAFCLGKSIDSQAVQQMLGIVSELDLIDLLAALASNEVNTVMQIMQRLTKQSDDYDDLMSRLGALLHALTLIQVAPKYVNHLSEALQAIATQIDAETVQLFYQIVLNGRRDLAFAPDPQTGFSMTLLRMLAFYPEFKPNSLHPTIEKNAVEKEVVCTPAIELNNSEVLAQSISHEEAHIAWQALLKKLPCLPATAKQIVDNSICTDFQKERIVLCTLNRLKAAANFIKPKLEVALKQHFTYPVTIEYHYAEDLKNTTAFVKKIEKNQKNERIQSKMAADETVQSLMARFDATLELGSITEKDQSE